MLHRYVMFTLESPENDDFPYNQFDDFFNWTMTYRLDRSVVKYLIAAMCFRR